MPCMYTLNSVLCTHKNCWTEVRGGGGGGVIVTHLGVIHLIMFVIAIARVFVIAIARVLRIICAFVHVLRGHVDSVDGMLTSLVVSTCWGLWWQSKVGYLCFVFLV